jgi:hypothetical protein
MNNAALSVGDPFEALVVEQALASARELRRTVAAAPDGRVLARAESTVVAGGREFLRRTLKAALEADALSKKRRSAAADKAGGVEGGVGGRCSPSSATSG